MKLNEEQTQLLVAGFCIDCGEQATAVGSFYCGGDKCIYYEEEGDLDGSES